MSRAAIKKALDRYKLRTIRVRDEPRWAVFDGPKQVTNANGYDTALFQQRELTIDAIEQITGGKEC